MADDMKRHDDYPAAYIVQDSQQVGMDEEARLRKEAQDALDGAAVARAKRKFPFEVAMFVGAVFFSVINLATQYLLVEELGRLSTSASKLDDANRPNATVVAAYQATLLQYPPSDACDAAYFANSGYATLKWQLNSLYIASMVFFYIALLPNLMLVIYRFGHLRALHAAAHNITLTTYKRRDGRGTFQRPNTPDYVPNNPVGVMNIGDMTMSGRISRAERMAFRGEYSGYLVLVMLQEVPLVMIYFLFTAFVNRYRGLDCALCLQSTGAPCATDSLFSIVENVYVKWALAFTFLTVVYNFITIMIRWLIYLQTVAPRWSIVMQIMSVVVGLITVAMMFIGPVSILFAAYLMPAYYTWWANQAHLIALSAISNSIAASGIGAFALKAGLIPGEACVEGLICWNIEEVCFLALPCFALCECCGICLWCDCGWCENPCMCGGGDQCCPCCCCC